MRDQDEVLDRAADLAAARARIVYVTCSVLPEENEAQVYGFCEANPDFEIVSTADRWAELFGEDKPQPWSADMMSVTLTPAATNTDGFFFCVMEKAS